MITSACLNTRFDNEKSFSHNYTLPDCKICYFSDKIAKRTQKNGTSVL